MLTISTHPKEVTAKMYLATIQTEHGLKTYLAEHPDFKTIREKVEIAWRDGGLAMPWRAYIPGPEPKFGHEHVDAPLEIYGVDLLTPEDVDEWHRTGKTPLNFSRA